MTSLSEFAAKDSARPGPSCWLCGIPEREEAEAGYRSGVPRATIVRWLKSIHGDVVSNARVTHHMANHVAAS